MVPFKVGVLVSPLHQKPVQDRRVFIVVAAFHIYKLWYSETVVKNNGANSL
jgi:hypothetical protein